MDNLCKLCKIDFGVVSLDQEKAFEKLMTIFPMVGSIKFLDPHRCLLFGEGWVVD